MGLAKQLIDKSQEKIKKSNLKIKQQVAESLSEVDDINNQIKMQIQSEWGVIDIAMNSIMGLTEQLHVTENERNIRRYNGLKY